MNDDALADIAIMRLQRAYADVSTRRAWPEFAALAIPDARFSFDTRTGDVIEMVGVDAFAEFGATMTDRFAFYEYVPLNFVVEIDPAGTARGRSYSFEIGEDRDTRRGGHLLRDVPRRLRAGRRHVAVHPPPVPDARTTDGRRRLGIAPSQ